MIEELESRKAENVKIEPKTWFLDKSLDEGLYLEEEALTPDTDKMIKNSFCEGNAAIGYVIKEDYTLIGTMIGTDSVDVCTKKMYNPLRIEFREEETPQGIVQMPLIRALDAVAGVRFPDIHAIEINNQGFVCVPDGIQLSLVQQYVHANRDSFKFRNTSISEMYAQSLNMQNEEFGPEAQEGALKLDIPESV